jgi:hypothetical protein
MNWTLFCFSFWLNCKNTIFRNCGFPLEIITAWLHLTSVIRVSTERIQPRWVAYRLFCTRVHNCVSCTIIYFKFSTTCLIVVWAQSFLRSWQSSSESRNFLPFLVTYDNRAHKGPSCATWILPTVASPHVSLPTTVLYPLPCVLHLPSTASSCNLRALK